VIRVTGQYLGDVCTRWAVLLDLGMVNAARLLRLFVPTPMSRCETGDSWRLDSLNILSYLNHLDVDEPVVFPTITLLFVSMTVMLINVAVSLVSPPPSTAAISRICAGCTL